MLFMTTHLIDFANSLRPNLKDDRIELWLKAGMSRYIRARYTEGQAEAADIRPLERCSPSTLTPEELEKKLESPISWKQLYDKTKRTSDGLMWIPSLISGVPVSEYAQDGGDMITIEFDHISLEGQQKRLQEFEVVTGLRFFGKVFSGKKSIHAFLALDDRISADKMRHLSRLAFLCFESDPSLGEAAAFARYPGGYRSGEGADQEQTLLEHHKDRNSFDVLEASLRNFYSFRHRMKAPVTIPDAWWAELRPRLLKGTATELIQEGLESWSARVAAEKAEHDRIRAENLKKYTRQYGTGVGSFNRDAWVAIKDARSRAPRPTLQGEKRKRQTSSYPGGVTGFCPLHGGNTGNSAVITESPDGWHFACWTCTHDGRTRQNVDALEYEYMNSGALFSQLPRGNSLQDWLLFPHLENFARDFCRRNGVTFPDRADYEPKNEPPKKLTTVPKKVVSQEKELPKEESQEESNVIPFRPKGRWTIAELKEALNAIVREGADGSDAESRLLDIITKSGYVRSEVYPLYVKLTQGDVPDQFDRFDYLNQEDTFCCVPYGIYGELLDLMEKVEGLNLAALQLPILSCASALYPKTRLILNPASGWVLKPAIWSVVVGAVGTAKSLAISLAGSPLIEMDREIVAQYEAERKEWEEAKKLDEKAKAPDFSIRIAGSDFTTEALLTQFYYNKGHGISYITEELCHWASSMDAYRKGGGGLDRARYLKLADGQTMDVSRKSGFTAGGQPVMYIEEPIFSMTGAAQPDVIRGLMRGPEDGLCERFMFAPTLDRMLKPSFSGEKIKLPSMLKTLYKNLMGLPPLNLRLSAEAQERYKVFFDKLDTLFRAETVPSLKHLYAKHNSHCARVAMCIHMMRLASGEIDQESMCVIDDDTMIDAEKMTEYSLSVALGIWMEQKDPENRDALYRKIKESWSGQTIRWTNIRHLGRPVKNNQMFSKQEVIQIFQCMKHKRFGTYDEANETFTVF